MPHIEFIIMLVTILLAFISGTVNFMYSIKSKSRIVQFYLKIFFALTAFHFIGFVYAYTTTTSIQPFSNVYLVLGSLLYIVVGIYTQSLLQISQELLQNDNSLVKWTIQIIPFVLVATYIISISNGPISEISDSVFNNLWITGMFTQFPAFLLTIILLALKNKNIDDPGMKKLARGLVIIVVAYFPFMIIESVIINIFDWYPLETNLRVFHLVFIIWCIYSSSVFILQLQQNTSQQEYVLSASYNISNRENEIVKLIIDKNSVQEIADSLFISPRTVEKHIANIYKKTKVNNRKDLIALTGK